MPTRNLKKKIKRKLNTSRSSTKGDCSKYLLKVSAALAELTTDAHSCYLVFRQLFSNRTAAAKGGFTVQSPPALVVTSLQRPPFILPTGMYPLLKWFVKRSNPVFLFVALLPQGPVVAVMRVCAAPINAAVMGGLPTEHTPTGNESKTHIHICTNIHSNTFSLSHTHI